MREAKTMRMGAVVLAIFCLAMAAPSYAVSVTLAPDMWVLQSAGGANEDLQAVIRVAIPAGSRVTDFEVNMTINGSQIARAQSGYYCYVDSNFLADFNKQEVFANPVVQDLAGSTVDVVIDGALTVTLADGEPALVPFAGSAPVTIVGDPPKPRNGAK